MSSGVNMVSGHSVTLANSIIGVGILAMPFCFSQCGILLSIVLLMVSGVMTRLSCHFLLRASTICKRRNFEVLAYHVFGAPGKFAVDVGIIGFLMGTCVAYFVVVGDLGPQIIAKMLNMNHSEVLRTSVMIVVSVVCVLPLGLMKDLGSFSNVSAVTIGFYFCLIIKIMAEATNRIASGEWLNTVEYWRPEGVLQCLPIFSMALTCQTQLFEVYEAVPGASSEKMNLITKSAVNICTTVYILVGFFGYVAFSGQNISGNVLISFSPSMASDVIKVGFVLSLAFSFPLIIFPCRSSLHSLLYKKGQVSTQDIVGVGLIIPETRFKVLTILIIGISLIIGLMLPNIELVLGLVGSTIGVMICVIFPATSFICLSKRNTNDRILAQVLLVLGILIMVLGTYANLQAAEMDKIALENKLIHSIDTDIQSNLEDSHIKTFEEVKPQEEDKIKIVNVKDSKSKELLLKERKVNKSDNIVNVKNSSTAVENSLKPTETSLKMDEIEKMKNEELIETMKKHEEEQRKMVEEQKQILLKLEEMKKDDSMQVNKEKVETQEDKNEAAVESIKKLAQIAIESLGGDNEVSVNTGKPSNVKLDKNVDVVVIEKKPLSEVNADNKQTVRLKETVQKLDNANPVKNKTIPVTEKNNQVESPIDDTAKVVGVIEKKSPVVNQTNPTTEKSHAGGKRDILEA